MEGVPITAYRRRAKPSATSCGSAVASVWETKCVTDSARDTGALPDRLPTLLKSSLMRAALSASPCISAKVQGAAPLSDNIQGVDASGVASPVGDTAGEGVAGTAYFRHATFSALPCGSAVAAALEVKHATASACDTAVQLDHLPTVLGGSARRVASSATSCSSAEARGAASMSDNLPDADANVAVSADPNVAASPSGATAGEGVPATAYLRPAKFSAMPCGSAVAASAMPCGSAVAAAVEAKRKQAVENRESEFDAENDVESESEVSNCSEDVDALAVEVDPEKTWTTVEDADLLCIEKLSAYMRSCPLLPPLPFDGSGTWSDVMSGIKFPLSLCFL